MKVELLHQTYSENHYLTVTLKVDGEVDSITVTAAEDKFNEALVLFNDGKWEELYALMHPEKVEISNAIKDSGYEDSDVVVKSGRVYYKGSVIDNVLSEEILKQAKNKTDSSRLIAFLERIMNSPRAKSIAQFYNFMKKNDIHILADGSLLLFKGVQADYYSYYSGHEPLIQGTRRSDGRILNKPGSTIEMKPTYVAVNSSQCSAGGLHVGHWKYASTFANLKKTLACIVNPEDIISVPEDYDFQKVRVCKYYVAGAVDSQKEAIKKFG